MANASAVDGNADLHANVHDSGQLSPNQCCAWR